MNIYDFTLILDKKCGIRDLDEVIIAAGINDSTLILQRGTLQLSFDREAESLEAAILSAIAQVEELGVKVERIVIFTESLMRSRAAA